MSPALVLCLLAFLTTPASGDAAPTCDGHWRAYPSHLGDDGNVLTGAAVLNPHDAWAVGFHQTPTEQHPIIEHWDGTAWGAVAVPSTTGSMNLLNDVDALTATDAWAVGMDADGPLLMHWDGTSWSVVAGANGVKGDLRGVDMVASNDVWAVGHRYVGAGWHTLAEHWDGSSWTVVPTPNPRTRFNSLVSVSATSSGLAFASGYRRPANLYVDSTLLERWDGSAWHIEPVRRYGAFFGVWTPSGEQAFAAGPPVMRWDGTTWAAVAYPEPKASFSGMSGRSTDGGVWAVGSRDDHGHYNAKTAIIRWTGARWIAASVPSPGYRSQLVGVAASEPFVWAVGVTQTKAGIDKALILGVC